MTSPPWTPEQLASDAVSKKQLVTYLHERAPNELLMTFKLNGTVANVAKASTKAHLISAYNELFASGKFRAADEPPPTQVKAASLAADTPKQQQQQQPDAEANSALPAVEYFKKTLVSKGDGVNRPKKGDMVSIWYTGALLSGKVFDSNTAASKKKKKNEPLKFKVGSGRAIRGLEEGIQSMSKGEKCKLTIAGEHAYGRKGLPDAGIGPNETLVFDVELVDID